MNKILVFVSLLCAVLQIVTAQSPSYTTSQTYSGSGTYTNTGSYTGSITGTYSVTGTYSGTGTYSVTGTYTGSNTYSGSGTYTNSNSYTGSQSFSISSTYSATYSSSYSPSYTASLSFTNSNTYSTSITAALGYPQITGITNSPPSLFNLNLQWQPPANFAYQFYEVFLIVNGTALVLSNILPANIVLNAANTNGLVQPGTTYVVQVRGFLNGAYGPQSLPVLVSTSGGDVYGPVGTDGNSINSLTCTYFPKNLRCTWNTGNRLWVNATFYVDCTRKVTPYVGARAWIVQKVINTAGSTTLPTVAVVPLPSGCGCTATLTAYYLTAVFRVDLSLPGNVTGFINTDKSNLGFINTPTTLY